MGYRNAVAVLAMWGKLDPLPKLLLLGMALRSIDPPGRRHGRPPCMFFGGENELREITGRGRTITYQTLAALREVGAVEKTNAGIPGRRAAYRLNLDAFDDLRTSGNE